MRGLICLLFLIITSNVSIAQLTLSVTVDSGISTTDCTDILGGAPDPLWRVNIDGAGWSAYSNGNVNGCHETYPREQYSVTVDCLEDLGPNIQVCFRSFDNDGFGCALNEDCLVEDCQNYAIPAVGTPSSNTLTLPSGSDSGGELNFTITLSGNSVASTNDLICDATDLGELPLGGTLGVASAGGFNNICSSNVGDVDPADDGAFDNDQGVWVQFTTSATPGHELLIEALDDPTNAGNDINLELAVYTSDDGSCSGNLTLLEANYDWSQYDESLTLECPEASTTYFILVDGLGYNVETEGYFGIQITDQGGQIAGERRCDAVDMGMIPVGGNVVLTDQANHCANDQNDPNPSAFISQKSVWFSFQAPPSGHVIIDAVSDAIDPIGLQLALYRSFNNTCSGFFSEVASIFTIQDIDEVLDVQCLDPGDNYWILVDGSGSDTEGIFDLTIHDGGISPPSSTLDTTICFGTSITVGTATYDETDSYTFVFQLPSGCDSTVTTNLIVADSLSASGEQIQLASSATNADGSVGAVVVGGVPPYNYLWDTGATTETISGIPAGNYCVLVTDSIGCSAQGCILLEFSTLKINAVGSDLSCFGNTNGTIMFSAEDGTSPYNYSYADASGTITGTGVILADGESITIGSLPAEEYQINIEDNVGNSAFVNVEVTQPLAITSDLNETLCFGDSILVGTNFYKTSGAINEILTATNGCDSIVTGTLVVQDDPSTPIDAILCFGDSVIVGNSVYKENGIHQDTFLTAFGCDSIVTTNVLLLEEITLGINATILPTSYSASDGEAMAVASGGAGGFSYLWEDGSTDQSLPNVTGGEEYCVTVTDDNNCSTAICETILYENNIALATADSLNCNGVDDGIIDISVSNGLGDYTYFWQNTTTSQAFSGIIPGNSGTDQITGLSVGNYSITVSDTYVSTILTLEIAEPTVMSAVILFPLDNLCQGDCDASIVVEPSGGTPPYSFSWSGGLPSVADPTDLCSGIYDLVISDANGCTFELALNITEPEILTLEANIESIISCGGEADGVLSASATGGFGTNYVYQWSNGENLPTIRNISTGTYTVTVFDGGGCSTTSSIFIPEPTPITFEVNTTDVDCWNGLNSGSISIDNVSGGTGPYEFSFSGGSFSSISNRGGLTAGSYQVTVQDDMGCVATTNAIINLPALINLTLDDDKQIYLGETVRLDANNSSNNALVTWNLDSCTNCPTIELQPFETTAYEVTVLDTITGCSESDVIWVNVSQERRVFIPNAFSPNEDGINDLFTVFGDTESIVNINSLHIFDRWGASLFEIRDLAPNDEAAGWNGFFDNKRLPVGVYIYMVEIEFIDGKTEIFKGDVALMR